MGAGTGTVATVAGDEGMAGGAARASSSRLTAQGSGACKPKFVFVWNMVPDSSLSALHGAFLSLSLARSVYRSFARSICLSVCLSV